ncbi:hypothetical protein D5086_009916 [Populus alba]|uniref:Uncharacterized protein n=1 Tax=Populus alba TaxID=43335 RepID=A0ACC4C8M4_POPAL
MSMTVSWHHTSIRGLPKYHVKDVLYKVLIFLLLDKEDDSSTTTYGGQEFSRIVELREGKCTSASRPVQAPVAVKQWALRFVAGPPWLDHIYCYAL